MSKSVIFVCIFMLVCVQGLLSMPTETALFDTFIADYGKTYSGEEYATRFQIFQANLERIKKLNSDPLRQNTRYGITTFADLTPEEFQAQMLRPLSAADQAEFKENAIPATVDLKKDYPKSFDWREKGAVTPVKNQGHCGSCWAFSTTGNLEGQHFIKNKELITLSEQYLVDCDHTCGTYRQFRGCDAGCNGGLMPNAFKYVIKNGIVTEDKYPYVGSDGTCKTDVGPSATTITNFTMISEDEEEMLAYLVEHGPITIAADASVWQFYVGGVLTGPCGTSLNHGILIVGYGVEKNSLGTFPYWIVKNSWGTDWGLKGYILIGRGNGVCGVNLFASSATME